MAIKRTDFLLWLYPHLIKHPKMLTDQMLKYNANISTICLKQQNLIIFLANISMLTIK